MQLMCSILLPSGYVRAAYVLKIRNNRVNLLPFLLPPQYLLLLLRYFWKKVVQSLVAFNSLYLLK